MDQNLTYQKAKKIRGAKLTDLFADQLLYEPTVGKALRKTISLKMQSKIKGIKEKFDPLNIVKYLTGGSTLGPALYGKLMGRSVRDIEYFTGRNRPLRVGPGRATGSRITPMGDQGNIDGINEQLLKIYSFLKTSKEQETKRREKEQNFSEERTLESEKRHKEFIEAIRKFKTGRATATKITKGEETKESSDGFIGNLISTIKNMIDEAISGTMKIVKRMIDGIENAFKWVTELKPLASLKKFGSLLRFLASPLFSLLTNPVLLTIGTVLGLAYLLKKLADAMPDYSQKSVEELKNILENGSEHDIAAFGGREAILKEIDKKRGLASKELERTDLTREERKTLEKISETKVTPQTETELPPVPPRPDTSGGKNKLRASNWDRQFGKNYNWDGTPKVTLAAKPLPQNLGQIDDAEEARKDFAAGDPRRLDLPKGAAFGVKPHGIPTVDDRLHKAMLRNIEAGLPDRSESGTKNVVNNVVKGKNPKNQKLATLDEIAVHNDEPTFLRMIMNSTRLV